jgi:hypothetical protein
MWSLVRCLIDEDKFRLPKLDTAVHSIPPPDYLNMSFEDLPPTAQYKYLCNQEHVVKLMLLGREVFWRNEIGELETLIMFSADHKRLLLEQIGSYRLCHRFGGSKRSSGNSACQLPGFDQRGRHLKRHNCGAGRIVTKCDINGLAAHRGSSSHVPTTSLTIL